ncbi:thioredoxin family protein [Lacinutrix jangbogonensis]|uniref:thioredoxin family protein n=1 Tax=Lacinutrix jangbogonensis TaxID=1469557 RepID=UPI00053D1DCD|nr:thioredoxin family protein [Lacinutrix jangbogonensis]
MKFKHILLALIFIASAQFAIAQESTKTIVERAQITAKKENKNIFIMFHASWCGWCKKMDKNMKLERTLKLFNNNYVIEHITVLESKNNKKLENPNGAEFLKANGGENQGLPYWIILDADGKQLINSKNNKDQNLGCPATLEEVNDFIGKLKTTSKLNAIELEIIKSEFIKK